MKRFPSLRISDCASWPGFKICPIGDPEGTPTVPTQTVSQEAGGIE